MDNNLINKIEDGISLGYQWIEKIEEEYRITPRERTSEVLSKYYRLVTEWQEQVKRDLPNEYRRREFANAKSKDSTVQSGKSVDIQNLVKGIEVKIIVLKEYKAELRPPSINLSVLGLQSRVNINSTDNSTNVIADQFSMSVNQIESEIEQNYKGADKEELLSLVSELKNKQNDPYRARQIIGTILTRGSELAQIASLVVQVLTMLPAK